MKTIKQFRLFGILFCGFLLFSGIFVAYVFGQPLFRSADDSKLQNAIAILNEGNAKDARDLITTIEKTDPEYTNAQFYKAICSYQLNDFADFVKITEGMMSLAPLDIRDKLARMRLDVLYRYRRFDELLSKIDQLSNELVKSADQRAAVEYRMASLFECGLKNANDAKNLQDEAKLNRRQSEVRTNFNRFLVMASNFNGTNYNILTKRVLQDDVWRARIILGDSDTALGEIPLQNTAAREQFNFLRIQLLVERLERKKIDRNLALLTEFLQQFPESRHLRRIAFDLYNCSFHKGKQLCEEAITAEKSGDTARAKDQRALAREHFEYVRSLKMQMIPDKASGIEESDVLDYRDDVLDSYYIEGDYSGLLAASSAMAAEFEPGSIGWMIAKVFNGIALISQSEPQMKEAAAVLDQVLAQGFKNKPDNDHWIIAAAKWRVHLAFTAGDQQKAIEIIRAVSAGNCTKNIKSDFLKVYGAYVGIPTN